MSEDITSDDWKQNTLPMTLCGPSGGGKTSMTNCLMDRWDGTAILFDLDHEPMPANTVVESVDELRDALVRGEDRIAVRPPATVVRDPDLFEETVQYLLQLGNELRRSDADPILFAFDEAQDLQEKWAAVAMKRLRKRRIKPVALSQDPVSLPKRLRTIADANAWISPPTGDMKDSLEGMKYPVDVLEQLDPYDMIVFDEDWRPIGRVRAPERYAV